MITKDIALIPTYGEISCSACGATQCLYAQDRKGRPTVITIERVRYWGYLSGWRQTTRGRFVCPLCRTAFDLRDIPAKMQSWAEAQKETFL